MKYQMLKSLLESSLKALLNPPGQEKKIYTYVTDFDESEVIYRLDWDEAIQYKRTFTIDNDLRVSFGEPEKVIVSTVYEVVKMSDFELTEVIFAGKDSTKLKGKIFELGNYADKNFSLNENEFDKISTQFNGVDLDIEHATKPNGQFLTDILGHKFGALESISRKGNDIFGVVEIPSWLSDKVGKKIKVSLAFDGHSKNIIGCAIVKSPRIVDAVVTQFGESAASVLFGDEDKKPMNKIESFVAAFKAIFGNDASPEGLNPMPTAALPVATPISEDPKRAELEKQVAAFSAKAGSDFALSKYNSLLASKKILPAQEAHVVALYSDALKADSGGKVEFGDNGAVKTGSMVEKLDQLFSNMPSHELFGRPADAGANALPDSGQDDDDAKALAEAKRRGLEEGSSF